MSEPPRTPRTSRQSHAAKGGRGAAQARPTDDPFAAANWHHDVGSLIRSLDDPAFWDRLVTVLGKYVPLGNWVCMRFDVHAAPTVLAVCDGPADAMERFEGYLRSAYLIDPFVVALRDAPDLVHRGFVTLDDVAPDQFMRTEYYQHYFRLNVTADEVQYIVRDGAASRWVSLSLGSPSRFRPEHLYMLRLVSPWILALMSVRASIGTREDRVSAPPAAPSPDAEQDLTSREREVMHLMLGGHSSKLIARRLGISEETVKVHRRHIYSKFKVSTQSQLFSMFLGQRG